MADKDVGESADTRYDDGAQTDTVADIGVHRKRRRPAATITDVTVTRVETVTMTAAEQAEAVHALAVLIARWWQDNPPRAA